MLRDIVQLSNDELEQIIDKIGTVLKKLDPDEVPPVVYQILLLTNEHGLIIGRVIGYLSSYFNQTIIQEIDSEDLIGSTSKITLSSIRRSESIVMVHINSKASGHPIIKEVIKMLKSGLNVPDLIFNPFYIDSSKDSAFVDIFMSCHMDPHHKLIPIRICYNNGTTRLTT